MTHLAKLLFVAASGFALVACGAEAERKTSSTTQKDAAKTLVEAPPPKVEGPNYCYGREHNPEKPFRFVFLNLGDQKSQMKRIRLSLIHI